MCSQHPAILERCTRLKVSSARLWCPLAPRVPRRDLSPCVLVTPVYSVCAAEDTGGKPAILAEITHCGLTFESGRQWRCSPIRYDGWNLPGFDDSEWSNAINGILPDFSIHTAVKHRGVQI